MGPVDVNRDQKLFLTHILPVSIDLHSMEEEKKIYSECVPATLLPNILQNVLFCVLQKNRLQNQWWQYVYFWLNLGLNKVQETELRWRNTDESICEAKKDLFENSYFLKSALWTFIRLLPGMYFVWVFMSLYGLSSRLSLNESARSLSWLKLSKSERKSPTSRRP